MKLLHQEVEITPGRPGAAPQGPLPGSAAALPGSLVVHVQNLTSQENAVDIRLCCGQPFWDETWYSLIGLVQQDNPDPVTATKADKPGPRGRTLRIHLPRGAERYVLVRFSVPRSPLSRAGVYEFEVEIEQHITDVAADPRRESRVTRLPATAFVQPFHQWSMSVSPLRVTTSLFRRRGVLRVTIQNEGNDWLYCNLYGSASPSVLVHPPTERTAVPPAGTADLLEQSRAEPRHGTQREVPILVRTRLLALKGDPVQDPVHLMALRVDAPSVLPLSSASDEAPGALLPRETDESVTPAVDPVVVYRPVIPGGIAALFAKTLQLGQSMSQLAVAAVALLSVGLVGWEHWKNGDISIQAYTTNLNPGQSFQVGGRRLNRAQFFLDDVQLEAKPVDGAYEKYTLAVPVTMSDAKATLSARRTIPALTLLDPLLPSASYQEKLQIAKLPEPKKADEKPPTDPKEDPAKPADAKSGDGADKKASATDESAKKDGAADQGKAADAGKAKEFDPVMSERMLGIVQDYFKSTSALRAGRREEYEGLARSLTRLDPLNPDAWAALGVMTLERDPPVVTQSATAPVGGTDARQKAAAQAVSALDPARKNLEYALSLDPQSYLAEAGLGQYYLRKGQLSTATARSSSLVRAAQHLGKATSTKPDFARAYLLLAMVSLETQDYEASKSLCTVILSSLKLELPEARMVRGSAFLAESADPTRSAADRAALHHLALTDLEAAAKLDPDLPGLGALLTQARRMRS